MARADHLEEVESDLGAAGFDIITWYGVRIFTDAIDAEMAVTTEENLELLLDAEDAEGRGDPYRWMASQPHVVAAPRDQ